MCVRERERERALSSRGGERGRAISKPSFLMSARAQQTFDPRHQPVTHFFGAITFRRKEDELKAPTKVVLIRLGIYVFVNKARGGGSPKFFINTL